MNFIKLRVVDGGTTMFRWKSCLWSLNGCHGNKHTPGFFFWLNNGLFNRWWLTGRVGFYGIELHNPVPAPLPPLSPSLYLLPVDVLSLTRPLDNCRSHKNAFFLAYFSPPDFSVRSPASKVIELAAFDGHTYLPILLRFNILLTVFFIFFWGYC